MATVRHHGLVLRRLATIHRVDGGLHCCAKFSWNRRCNFEDMRVSTLHGGKILWKQALVFYRTRVYQMQPRNGQNS